MWRERITGQQRGRSLGDEDTVVAAFPWCGAAAGSRQEEVREFECCLVHVVLHIGECLKFRV
jgi:hypothetical protein